MPTCLAAGQESEFLGLLLSCCTDSDDVSILGGGFNAVFECLDRRWSLMILNFRICVQYLLQGWGIDTNGSHFEFSSFPSRDNHVIFHSPLVWTIVLYVAD